jgi:hypothetical protein
VGWGSAWSLGIRRSCSLPASTIQFIQHTQLTILTTRPPPFQPQLHHPLHLHYNGRPAVQAHWYPAHLFLHPHPLTTSQSTAASSKTALPTSASAPASSPRARSTRMRLVRRAERRLGLALILRILGRRVETLVVALRVVSNARVGNGGTGMRANERQNSPTARLIRLRLGRRGVLLRRRWVVVERREEVLLPSA